MVTQLPITNDRTGATNGREVVIRMYNVGFGDAFLVLLPDGKNQRRILFDCGSVEAAEDAPMDSIVDRIIRDVTDEDEVARIDVVVGTHRHKDHVSGFARSAWDNVEVKEVWMPWTEDPKDFDARRIRETQSRLALGLNAAFAAKLAVADNGDKKKLQRCQSLVENALTLTNDREMKVLHNGFSGNPERRFLPEADKDKVYQRVYQTDVLPGVKVHVLGPSRETQVIRDMEPPKGGSYLAMRAFAESETGKPPAPFGVEYQQKTYSGGGTLPDKDKEKIKRAAELSDLAVAVALDKAVNGTSLMLVLEIADTFLLFPGDAQWGTWCAAMEDPEWKEMLGRVSFYKIGHHGSHNATPKKFVESMMPDGICAMASTLTRGIWPDIPRAPLLDALSARHVNLARSDDPDNIGNVFKIDEGVIETRIPL